MADNAAPVFLLTRPRAQSERFAQQMRDVLGAQADIRIHSLQEIQALDVQVDLTGIAALAFTSENGARVFADQSTRRDLPAYCVGDRTAATAAELGFAAFSAGGTVDDLADLIVAAKPQGRVLHLQGKHKAGDLVAALTAQGVNAAGFEIYDQRALPVAPALHALAGARAGGGPHILAAQCGALLAGRAWSRDDGAAFADCHKRRHA